MPAIMNSKNAAMMNDPAKAANAATRSGATRRARNEYTIAMGAMSRKARNGGRLDGRELSPPSIRLQANAAISNKTTPTQPRIGARSEMMESAAPTPTAAKPRTCNALIEVMPSAAWRRLVQKFLCVSANIVGDGFLLESRFNCRFQGQPFSLVLRPILQRNGLQRNQEFAIIHFTGKRFGFQPPQCQWHHLFKMNVLSDCLADVFNTEFVQRQFAHRAIPSREWIFLARSRFRNSSFAV